jgi:homogentisate phytyltransferase/homogentisate geranylgeranyltransferase
MESLLSSSSLVSAAGGFCWKKQNLKLHSLSEIRVLRCDSSKVVAKPKFRNNLVRPDGQGSSLLLYPKHKSRFRVNATAGQPEAFDSNSKQKSFRDSLDAFYRFSRPHTVIGTVLSILSVSFLAVEKVSDISPLLFTGILEAVVAALMMNIYIVGLNQLSDVEIDKVTCKFSSYEFERLMRLIAASA